MRHTALVLLLAAWPLLLDLSAQEQVSVRRLSDQVAVRPSEAAPERVLHYFSATASLVQGGTLEQGSGGHSILELSAGGRVQMKASGRLILTRIDPEGDELSVPVVSQMTATSGQRRLTLMLPGALTCELDMGAAVEVHREQGRLRIRNVSGYDVRLRGALALQREAVDDEHSEIVLQRGEEVRMPHFDAPDARRGAARSPWGQLIVRHDNDVGFEPLEDQGLRLWTEQEAGSVLTVGGVITRLEQGAVLELANLRRPVLPRRAPLPEPIPEPVAEPAPEGDAEPTPEDGSSDTADQEEGP